MKKLENIILRVIIKCLIFKTEKNNEEIQNKQNNSKCFDNQDLDSTYSNRTQNKSYISEDIDSKLKIQMNEKNSIINKLSNNGLKTIFLLVFSK